jgi:hypothetical protein
MATLTDLVLPIISSGLTAGIVTFALDTMQQERAKGRASPNPVVAVRASASAI